MHLHTLCFANTQTLAAAFERLMSSEFVEDRLAEPELLRIRFVAPLEHANRLIENIYLDGGLTWTTRSSFPPASSSPTSALHARLYPA